MSKKRKLKTSFEVPIDTCFKPEHLGDFNYFRDLGDPGEFPFTRGVYSEMYRKKLWTMRQYAGFGTAKESNQRYKHLLEQGQTGLSVAFDLPTQMGMDSDAVLSAGEVGRTGVAIDSLIDMRDLLQGIPLDQVSFSMTINATAPILLAFIVAETRAQKMPIECLSGTIQNDILKEYIARGTYIYPPLPSMRLATDVINFCTENLPRWNPISISGYHIREAGSTAAQELAFTLANAIAYVEACLQTGLAIDDFAPRFSFFFNVHNNFLEEIAKFRAARRLWSGVMRKRFAAKNPKSWILRFHAQTAGSTLTVQNPEVNSVRVTLQALAAVLGGTQSLHTNSYDEALALPTLEAASLALKTQQVIAYETGVPEVADPLAGSYTIESLTSALEVKAQDYLDRIQTLGGMPTAISKGYVQGEIQKAAYHYQRSIESEETTVIGVNKFVSIQQPTIKIHKVNPETEKEQCQKLVQIRSTRNKTKVDKCLELIEKVACTNDNLLPAMIDAVECQTTLGEISDRLRLVFGEHQENPEL